MTMLGEVTQWFVMKLTGSGTGVYSWEVDDWQPEEFDNG